MKKDLVELVFIIDRSGSMSGLEEDTIRGFNDMVLKQKDIKGEALISTILFDDRFDVLHNRLDIKSVVPLTRHDYYVRGTTALLDAIGRSIRKISDLHHMLKDEFIPEKVLFVITTDGMENASREFSYKQIKSLIQEKTAMGWEFIFLGANIDAAAEANKIGSATERSANYRADSEGTSVNYQELNQTISHLRATKSINANWSKGIDEQFEKAFKIKE